MFVGEAPGAAEDRLGEPLAGPAAALLDEVLTSIGLRRADVAVINVLNCRPPDNRSPLPAELENCREYLVGQIELTQPVLVCSLGAFATRVLRGRPGPITSLRGHAEIVVVGNRAVRLLPLVHPAAALYTPAGVAQLRADVERIPGLLALGPPEQPQSQPGPRPEAEPEEAPVEARSRSRGRPPGTPHAPAVEPADGAKSPHDHAGTTGPADDEPGPDGPPAPPAEQLHLF